MSTSPSAARTSGPQTTRGVPWAGGASLQINLPAEGVPTPGGRWRRVTVTGPKALVDRVAVVDGNLRFTPADGEARVTVDGHGFNIDTVREGLKVTVVAPAVTKFVLNGSPSLSLTGYDQPALVIEINGSGDVTSAGKTQSLNLSIAGSGELASRISAVAQASTSAAAARPRSGLAVEVAIAGSGDVTLTTKPASLTSNIDGSGDLHLP